MRPPLIYGPRDRETLAFFTSVRNGVLPMTGGGKNTLSVVYVADCAAAIVRALTTAGAPSGRAYFVDDGAVYVWRDALADIESALGRRAFVRFGMPMGALKVAAAATQLWGKVTNTAQMLTLDKVVRNAASWLCRLHIISGRARSAPGSGGSSPATRAGGSCGRGARRR